MFFKRLKIRRGHKANSQSRISACPLPVAGLALLLALGGCATAPVAVVERGPTLATLDTDSHDGRGQRATAEVAAVSSEQVRQAYKTYLARADSDDRIRQAALNRLADIELTVAEAAFTDPDQDDDWSSTEEFEQGVGSTIELLTTSLRDYPDAPGNDRVLYKLAKAHDQLGDQEQSLAALRQLVERYPRSRYYVEARFRLGEHVFDRKDYAGAEHAFEEVISSPHRNIFYEKALFKRGWARFKQDYYLEAVDDFMRAVAHRESLPETTGQNARDSRIAEYFRGVGLAFSYLESSQAIEDYFQYSPWPGYEYRIYKAVADEFLKQQRYFDATATLQQYIAEYPDSPQRAATALAVADIWREAGMTARYTAEFEAVYAQYHPDAEYWRNPAAADGEAIADRLRQEIMALAGYYHHRYANTADETAYAPAQQWYQRYMRHFKARGREDDMFMGYGDLLASHGDLTSALEFYALAALENEVFVDRKAAYALVVTTDSVHRHAAGSARESMLAQHLKYATAYARQHSDDARVNDIIANAVELAFSAKHYTQAREIAALSGSTLQPRTVDIKLIQARSAFELGLYPEAERLFAQLLAYDGLDAARRHSLHDSAALAVYRQAEAAQAQGAADEALRHFGRIVEMTTLSEIAAKGLVDAIALANNSGLWSEAIDYAEVFQKHYPTHPLRADVAKKRSFAYIQAGQGLNAARAYEEVAGLEAAGASAMAALWQAGELYEQHDDPHAAARAYHRYALRFPEPFPQYMEAMHKLTGLYERLDDTAQAERWTDRILTAEADAAEAHMTPRVQHIAASAALRKAHGRREAFSRYPLRSPFEVHLTNKKALMQDASELYRQAYGYAYSQVKTEAMYSIATLFDDFSEAVLQSERPADLSGDDLEIYEIELEDLAFPLEQKAIELFEQTLTHIESGVTDQWVMRSVDRLAELFPARYARRPKVERYASLAF